MANGEINIYGAIRSQTGEGKAAFASQIWDEEQQKFQSQINQETANDGLVSAKVAQSFTDTEKEQARQNIDAASGTQVEKDESVVSETLAQMHQEIENIKDGLGEEEYIRARGIMLDRVPDVASGAMKLIASGAPNADVEPDNWDMEKYGVWRGVPRFIGQEYYDVVNKKKYEAFSLTNSVNDWVLMN